MAVTIEIMGLKATVEGRQWTAENETLRDTLQMMTDALYSGHGHWHPEEYVDRTIAERLSGLFGGEIVKIEPRDTGPPDPPDPNVVYSGKGEWDSED